MKTIVIGLGNPILSDDGVGVKVAYEVEDRLGDKIPKNVTITEASVGGLRLMELLEGYPAASSPWISRIYVRSAPHNTAPPPTTLPWLQPWMPVKK